MRGIRSLLLGAFVLGLACGDDGGNAPPVPTAINVTSGNNQSGLPGTTLPLPLTVTVLGAGNAPYPNVRVTWTVTAGGAGLGSPVDTTDANGVSSTTVSVGTVPGSLVITATVTGLTPVPFSLLTLNPCSVSVPGVLVDIDTLASANGVLTNFDCQFGGPWFTDFYRLVVPAQMGFVFNLTAAFDTWLELYHVSGPFIGLNNNLDSTTVSSRLQMILAPGTYVLAPSSNFPNVFGTYTITTAPRPQTIAGCGADPFLFWISRGVTLTEQVEATNCVTTRPGGGRAYGERVLVAASPTRPLSATVTAAFNPRLELYRLVNAAPGRIFVNGVDGNGTSVTLTHTPAAGDSVYRLEITSVDTVQTGAYTLTVTGPAPIISAPIVVPFGGGTLGRAPITRRGKE